MPLSNFVPRGFGFVHHSIAILDLSPSAKPQYHDSQLFHRCMRVDVRRPPWEQPPPEVGLAGMADRAVARATRDGALDNLPGAGKPLSVQDRHDDQFFTVDATLQAINRCAAALSNP